ncbi:MAG: hypothetical protein LBO66_01695 [Deltaproteobacteria bacterium]|jgi:flavorubredoxin|nr:hypothetical protein [Deltaproteobacteria bacterium]
MSPAVGDLLRDLKRLKTPKKIGASFGAHGWSGVGVKPLQAELASMGYALPSPKRPVQWFSGEKDLDLLMVERAQTVAAKLKTTLP